MAIRTEMQMYRLEQKHITFPWHTFKQRRDGYAVWGVNGYPEEQRQIELNHRKKEKVYLKENLGLSIPTSLPEKDLVDVVGKVSNLLFDKKIVIVYGATLSLRSCANLAMATYYLTTGEPIIATDTGEFMDHVRSYQSKNSQDYEFDDYKRRLSESLVLWRELGRRYPYAVTHGGFFSEAIEGKVGEGLLATITVGHRKIKGNYSVKDRILDSIEKAMGDGVATIFELDGLFISSDNIDDSSDLKYDAKNRKRGGINSVRLGLEIPEVD